MGIFTSKIAIGVLAGGFTLAGAGLLFNGSETLNKAKTFVTEAGQKITQYETNEQALIGKFNQLKLNSKAELEAANNTINEKKIEISKMEGQIADLNKSKGELETSLANLKNDMAAIQKQLTDANGDKVVLQQQLDQKTAAYNEVSTKLVAANKQIADGKALLDYAYAKAKEADGHIAKLEAEIQKANNEVADMGKKVEEIKAQTKDKAPLAPEEIDQLETSVPQPDNGNK